MSKRKARRNPANEQNDTNTAEQRKITMANVSRLLVAIAVTIIIFCLYRFLISQYYFEIVLIIYMVAAAAVIIAYVMYNRGFSRRGVTPQMLPKDWSEEQKREFIEDGELRLKKSRPLAILIFAFVFTFVVDILELYALPLLQEMFSK